MFEHIEILQVKLTHGFDWIWDLTKETFKNKIKFKNENK